MYDREGWRERVKDKLLMARHDDDDVLTTIDMKTSLKATGYKWLPVREKNDFAISYLIFPSCNWNNEQSCFIIFRNSELFNYLD